MCGIAGMVMLDPRAEVEPERLRRMRDEIRHRGPDDAGFMNGDGCSIGARRLSIIDVEGGHQPFGDERVTFDDERRVTISRYAAPGVPFRNTTGN